MTFADRLEELLKRDSQTLQEAAEKRFSLDDLLANNADAILELVRAADNVEGIFYRSDATPIMRRERDVLGDLRDALAKLNGEQT